VAGASGVQGVQFHFGLRRVEGQRAQHCLADPADPSLRGVTVEADPRSEGDPGASAPVLDLSGHLVGEGGSVRSLDDPR
jgi:hypothetical protein